VLVRSPRHARGAVAAPLVVSLGLTEFVVTPALALPRRPR
jgi:hypothetical protein